MRITELVKESDSILDAQKEAGHHNLTSTLWYNHLTIKDLRPFYERGSNNFALVHENSVPNLTPEMYDNSKINILPSSL